MKVSSRVKDIQLITLQKKEYFLIYLISASTIQIFIFMCK